MRALKHYRVSIKLMLTHTHKHAMTKSQPPPTELHQANIVVMPNIMYLYKFSDSQHKLQHILMHSHSHVVKGILVCATFRFAFACVHVLCAIKINCQSQSSQQCQMAGNFSGDNSLVCLSTVSMVSASSFVYAQFFSLWLKFEWLPKNRVV